MFTICCSISGYAYNTAASIQGALLQLLSASKAVGNLVLERPSMDYLRAQFPREAKRLLMAIHVSVLGVGLMFVDAALPDACHACPRSMPVCLP